jgi:hypothetical protein
MLTFRHAKITEHANPSPQGVHGSYFSTEDMAIAKTVRRHICLDKRQLLALMRALKLQSGEHRLNKLVRYGLLDRHKAYTAQGGTCGSFYALGPRGAELLSKPHLPPPEPGHAASIIATNQLLIATMLNQGGFTYQITSKDAPVTGYVSVRFNVYSLMAPNDAQEVAACIEHMKKARLNRAIFILPDRSLVPPEEDYAGATVFFAFDQDTLAGTDTLWRRDIGTLRDAEFYIGRAAM